MRIYGDRIAETDEEKSAISAEAGREPDRSGKRSAAVAKWRAPRECVQQKTE